jgi:glycosyltransferase involved in cell wall biosynthesis
MLVHIVTDRFSTGGGIEHIYQLVKGLSRVRFVIYGRPGEAQDKFAGLPNVSLQATGYPPLKRFSKTPDLIHFHHFRPLFRFAVFRRRFPVPVIYTAHGLHVRKYQFKEGWLPRVLFRLRFALERMIFRRLDLIIAVSRADFRFLTGRYGISQHNVRYQPNGIQAPSESGSDPVESGKLREEWGAEPGTRVFITVARFDFQKGYDILLRAVHQVSRQAEPGSFLFLLVGDGKELEEMRKMAGELGITRWVRFLGRRVDVYRLLMAADIYVLPSRWEGLPIGIIEAGYLGLPVIASDTCGNREMIEDQRGILFENRDSEDLAAKIDGVLQDRYELPLLTRQLRNEVMSRYSVDQLVSGTIRLYRHCAR